MIFPPFLRQQKQLSISNDPLGNIYNPLNFFSPALSCSWKTTEGVEQDALNRTTIGGHQQLLGGVLCFLRIPGNKVSAEPSLLALLCSQPREGPPVCDVNSQEAEIQHHFHPISIDVKRFNVHFLFPEIHNNLLCLGCVQEQAVVPAQCCQLLHFVPVGRFILPQG